MVKMRLKWAAAAGAMSVALVGACSSPQASDIGTPVDSASAQLSQGSTNAPADADEATAREIDEANLQPCPPSDTAIEPVSGGLPDLNLACLAEGPSVDLAGLRGKPMVVNVWASWCGPCRAELPILGEVSQQSRDKIDFLGINVSDTRKAALKMAGSYKMRFPSVFDPAFKTRPSLRVGGVPITLFVRANGTIAYRHNGPITSQEQLKQLIYTSLGVQV